MKQNYLVFFVLFFICKSLGFSQIVNEGTLKIMSGTTVYFGNEYTNKSTGTHNNDGVLYLNHNFINNGTTTAANTSATHFTGSGAIQEIKGSANKVNFYNLIINNTFTGVSVVDAFELNVANAVTLNNGDLRLVGEAQLLQTNNVPNSGLGKLLRDQQGISSVYGYNYWSSPVNTSGSFSLVGGIFDGTDATINSFVNSFTPKQIGFNSGSSNNGAPAIVDGSGNVTTALKINTRWLYKYSRGSGSYSEWVPIYPTNTGLLPGEGFTMKGTGTGAANQNYVFKGTPNNGDYSFPIATGESILLGNPYPSALDVVQFITENISVNEVLFWVDGDTGSHYLAAYEGGYAVRSIGGGVPPSAPVGILGSGTSVLKGIPTLYIAVAQGFFVTAINNVDIVFKNSQRAFQTENITDSNFYKNAKANNNDFSKNTYVNSGIRIGYENPEKFHRQILLGFLPESPANVNYNRGYDAIMADPRNDELFFIIDNDSIKKYVIQGVGAFDENDEFPLGLKITQEGTHTIMIDTVENFAGNVYIKDVLANITYDLTKGNFSPNLPPGSYLDRFRLVFKDKYAVVVAEDIAFEVNTPIEKTIVYYHDNGSLIVKIKNDLQVNNITIYNILGQQIKQAKGNEPGKNVIAIPFQYPKGVYMVIVESELGKETFKIVNK